MKIHLKEPHLHFQYCPFKPWMIESFTAGSLRWCPGTSTIWCLIVAKFQLLRFICFVEIRDQLFGTDWRSRICIASDEERRKSPPIDGNSTYPRHHGGMTRRGRSEFRDFEISSCLRDRMLQKLLKLRTITGTEEWHRTETLDLWSLLSRTQRRRCPAT